MAPQGKWVWLLLAAASRAHALHRAAVPTEASRRACLRRALAASSYFLLGTPSIASATCVCKTVSICECNDDAPSAKKTVEQRKRIDAAALSYQQDVRDREQFLKEIEEINSGRLKPKPAPRPSPPPRSPTPQYEKGSAARKLEPVVSAGTQEFTQIDPKEAKARLVDAFAC